MAFAINNMSASSWSHFKAFTPHNTILQFDLTYPSVGIILSMLGEKFFRFLPVRCAGSENGNLVTSHFPSQCAAAHSASKSNGNPCFLARDFAPRRSIIHG